MILKIEYYAKNGIHTRVLDVYDFHLETRTPEEVEKDPVGSEEIIYHTTNGKKGVVRIGHDANHPDCLYVMENGKTVDRMHFCKN